MKLYFSPGACSLVPHIALEEAGEPFEAIRVDFSKGDNRTDDYLAINPQGRVPALVDGDVSITEVSAIVGYVGDRFGKPGAAPAGDPVVAAQVREKLSWCASTVHISFAMVFRPERFAGKAPKAAVLAAQPRLRGHFARMNAMCENADGGWLVGDEFSAVDSYMAVFYRWAKRINVQVDKYEHWGAHVAKILEREAVKRAIANEGLEPEEFSA